LKEVDNKFCQIDKIKFNLKIILKVEEKEEHVNRGVETKKSVQIKKEQVF